MTVKVSHNSVHMHQSGPDDLPLNIYILKVWMLMMSHDLAKMDAGSGGRLVHLLQT